MLAISPPTFGGMSPPSSHRNAVASGDMKPAMHREHGQQMVCISSFHSVQSMTRFSQPLSFPRTFKDRDGKRRQPGLKELPHGLQRHFRDLFIRPVIEQVCLGSTPWTNPGLPVLQHQFHLAYPAYKTQLHSDDAAVLPVSLDLHCSITHVLMSECLDSSGSRGPSEPNWERRAFGSHRVPSRSVQQAHVKVEGSKGKVRRNNPRQHPTTLRVGVLPSGNYTARWRTSFLRRGTVD